MIIASVLVEEISPYRLQLVILLHLSKLYTEEPQSNPKDIPTRDDGDGCFPGKI